MNDEEKSEKRASDRAESDNKRNLGLLEAIDRCEKLLAERLQSDDIVDADGSP